MNYDADYLYSLLPATYRARDEQSGGALRAFLAVLASQSRVLEQDIARLYESWFIETCPDWVVPYIGDLVGSRPLHPVVQSRRADVAKTIYYRRRKGTLPMLEELARDVTGWSVHAVECFQLLGWTQNMNHLRFEISDSAQSRSDPFGVGRVGTLNLRDADMLDRLHGPFDAASHTVDVRPIRQSEGWDGIRKIAFHVYRLQAYPLEHVIARRSKECKDGFHFSPLGNPSPLFHLGKPETVDTATATEIHVTAPIRPLAFSRNPLDYWGSPNGLRIIRRGVEVSADAIVGKSLAQWKLPEAGKIAADVERGRLAFAKGEAPEEWEALRVCYAYGFSAPIGGGPYERRKWLSKPSEGTVDCYVRSGIGAEPHAPNEYDSVEEALEASAGQSHVRVRILDSGAYLLPESLSIGGHGSLIIESANGQRAHLITWDTGLNVYGKGESVFELNGILLEGFLTIAGDLARVRLVHSTLVPGRGLGEDGEPRSSAPSLIVAIRDGNGDVTNASLEIELSGCISGPLQVPREIAELRIEDSIVDGLGHVAISGGEGMFGPVTTVSRATILGTVKAQTLDGCDAIFADEIMVRNPQRGCMRFCFLASQTDVPRQYRCQPSLSARSAVAEALKADASLTLAARKDIAQRVYQEYRPDFATNHYGLPGYAQLRAQTPLGILAGSEEGSEMGVFCSVQQPQREANLTLRLAEYLPVGLEPGIIHAT